MRLIDADKLPWVDKVILVDNVDGDIVIKVAPNYTSYVNKETPTVEAIPIEFIKQLIEKFDCERGNAIKDTFAHILTGLLEFWEFEQEKENEESDQTN